MHRRWGWGWLYGEPLRSSAILRNGKTVSCSTQSRGLIPSSGLTLQFFLSFRTKFESVIGTVPLRTLLVGAGRIFHVNV